MSNPKAPATPSEKQIRDAVGKVFDLYAKEKGDEDKMNKEEVKSAMEAWKLKTDASVELKEILDVAHKNLEEECNMTSEEYYEFAKKVFERMKKMKGSQ